MGDKKTEWTRVDPMLLDHLTGALEANRKASECIASIGETELQRCLATTRNEIEATRTWLTSMQVWVRRAPRQNQG